MDWSPNENEIESVLALPSPKRYSYWIKKVVDEERIWSLWQNGGWAMAADDSGREVVPVWPHPKFCELCLEGAWKSFEPRSISLGLWLSRWLPGIEEDRRMVGVFPIPLDKGIVVEAARVRNDLNDELQHY